MFVPLVAIFEALVTDLGQEALPSVSYILFKAKASFVWRQ